MNAKSIADQLSLISTIIHQSKDCPEVPQKVEERGTIPEAVIQAAAVLEKIPLVQDTNVDATSAVAARS